MELNETAQLVGASVLDNTIKDDSLCVEHGFHYLNEKLVITENLLSPDKYFLVKAEDKLCIGRTTIFNKAPAIQMIFSASEMILLRGHITVSTALSDILFIAPQIICDGCKFSGLSQVAFYSGLGLPSGEWLSVGHNAFLGALPNEGYLKIKEGGFLSSSVNVFVAAGNLYGVGPMYLSSFTVKIAHDIKLQNKIIVKELNINSSGNAHLKDLYAKGNIEVNAGSIAIDKIESEKSIAITCNADIAINTLKANGEVRAISKNGNVIINERIESHKWIEIQAVNALVKENGVIHSQKVTFLLKSTLTLNSLARVLAQGYLTIETPAHKPIEKIELIGATMVSMGGAMLRAKLVFLNIDGVYKIKSDELGRYDGYLAYGSLRYLRQAVCFKEKLIGSLGNRSKFMIIGGVTIEINAIYTKASNFQITGQKEGNNPQIYDEKIILQSKGSMISNCYNDIGLREEQRRLVERYFKESCKIDVGVSITQISTGGEKTIEIIKDTTDHTSTIELERSTLSSEENLLANEEFSSVSIEEIETLMTEHAIESEIFTAKEKLHYNVAEELINYSANMSRYRDVKPSLDTNHNHSITYDFIEDKTRIWDEFAAQTLPKNLEYFEDAIESISKFHENSCS
jgi:hypothetical protein